MLSAIDQRYAFLRTAGPSLGAVFLASAEAHGARTALVVDGKAITYAELLERAGRVASVLAASPMSSPALGAVFAGHTLESYVGTLATLLAGAGYVPLNPRYPETRNASMLLASGARSLVIGAAFTPRLGALLAPLREPITVVIPDQDDIGALSQQHAPHTILGASTLSAARPLAARPAVDPHAIAYLMFTSGSTGTPRGVMVTHENVLHHLQVMWERYAVGHEDRFSQAFDLTFDLSVFDMFVPWGRGASVYSLPANEALAPAKFIQRSELSFWFSVPSTAIALQRLRLLKPGAFPSLRFSLFCGERLPASIAEAWQAAAPRSVVENLYGPTEATIACTLYRWDPARSPAECEGGVVPIGAPYPGLAAAIVDERLERASPGERGELCVRGPQVTAGYWKDPERTAERFVAMPWDGGPENRWYRTGDIAYVASHGSLVFAGRRDDQIKLRGFRVELAEIEHALRLAAKTELVAVVADTGLSETTPGVVGFVAGAEESAVPAILADLKQRLPDYMVPRDVLLIGEMPLNANGKIDKHQLRRIAFEDNNGNGS